MKKAMIVLLFLSLVISSCGPTQQGIGMAEKPKVAVGAIAIGYEDNSNALKVLSTQLTKAIVKSSKYTAVDRSEEILKQLGKEHGYQREGAVDDDQIRKLGVQFGVKYMCVVQSSRVMNGYMLDVRLVDVESAEIVNMGSVTNDQTNMEIEDLMRAAEELARQLLGSSTSGDRGSVSPVQKPAPLPEPAKTPVALSSASVAPSSGGSGTSGDVLTDSRDGKKYKVVKIGNQVWMAENLNYNASGSKCSKNNNASCDKYGRLYNWSTAKTVCPSGWHLPSKAEWDAMVAYIGGERTAGKKLKAKSGWYNNSNGTDEYGFSALPGGDCHHSDGSFNHVGDIGLWWSADEYSSYKAYNRYIYIYKDAGGWDNNDKSDLFSVRCLQNYVGTAEIVNMGSVSPVQKSAPPQEPAQNSDAEAYLDRGNAYYNKGNFIDSLRRAVRDSLFKYFSGGGAVLTDKRDGNRYKITKIGNQTWMAENLNYNANGSVCYDNNSGNCAKYGRLYNWATAKNACPSGWHLPSKSEYEALDRAVGGEKVAGKKLKAKSGWNNNGNGTDDYGFSALPGGLGFSDGSFIDVGYYGNWWSASEDDSGFAYCRGMYYGIEFADWYSSRRSSLLSVRCLQD